MSTKHKSDAYQLCWWAHFSAVCQPFRLEFGAAMVDVDVGNRMKKERSDFPWPILRSGVKKPERAKKASARKKARSMLRQCCSFPAKLLDSAVEWRAFLHPNRQSSVCV
jgi:hypothetical protein